MAEAMVYEDHEGWSLLLPRCVIFAYWVVVRYVGVWVVIRSFHQKRQGPPVTCATNTLVIYPNTSQQQRPAQMAKWGPFSLSPCAILVLRRQAQHTPDGCFLFGFWIWFQF